jgi:hypothetical protein
MAKPTLKGLRARIAHLAFTEHWPAVPFPAPQQQFRISTNPEALWPAPYKKFTKRSLLDVLVDGKEDRIFGDWAESAELSGDGIAAAVKWIGSAEKEMRMLRQGILRRQREAVAELDKLTAALVLAGVVPEIHSKYPCFSLLEHLVVTVGELYRGGCKLWQWARIDIFQGRRALVLETPGRKPLYVFLYNYRIRTSVDWLVHALLVHPPLGTPVGVLRAVNICQRLIRDAGV